VKKTYAGACQRSDVRFEVDFILDHVRCLDDVDLESGPIRSVSGSELS